MDKFNGELIKSIYEYLKYKHGMSEKTYANSWDHERSKLAELYNMSVKAAGEIKAIELALNELPTPEFDRFDICEAYYILEMDYNEGGWLHERASNQRRSMSSDVQLHRMHFRISPLHMSYENLTENGKAIYKLNEIAVLKKMFGIS